MTMMRRWTTCIETRNNSGLSKTEGKKERKTPANTFLILLGFFLSVVGDIISTCPS